MFITVFDTETTSLDKPFCYNIGYVIVNTLDWSVVLERSFVVEQIWHNLPLFSTAYYASKREIYVAEMRARKTIMDKFGYICQQMIRDFRQYNVERAFAYNSSLSEIYKLVEKISKMGREELKIYLNYTLLKNFQQ